MTNSLATSQSETQPSRAERAWLLASLLIAFFLRFWYAGHFRIDSDEPQHLHVVWGWVSGGLPYRDFFDNHMPLFQGMWAPLMAWFGERADVIVPMRMTEWPIYAGTVWAAGMLGRQLVSVRAGWWTALITALVPRFYLISLEFRPDNLWSLFWLLTLVVLAGGALTVRRGWWAGVLLGACFSVSMKSTLMLAALVLAGLTILLVRRNGREVPWRGLLTLLGGMLVLPALVVLYFAAHGATGDFFHCVIGHNMSMGGHTASRPWHKAVQLGRTMALSAVAAWLLWRLTPDRKRAWMAAFLTLAVGTYFGLLTSYWPIVTLEDYLPFDPALAAVAAPVLFHCTTRWRFGWVLPLVVVLAESALILRQAPPWVDETGDKIQFVRDVLRLTNPADYVMDSKGEAIYRRRPSNLILEGVTTRGIKAGRITNDIPERLIATSTPLVTYRRMPEETRVFMKANYVQIAFRLMTLGKTLYNPAYGTPPFPYRFHLLIPGRYSLVAESGGAPGTLNGTVPSGVKLPAGDYDFVPAQGTGRITLVWTQALERGYSPFAPVKPDYVSPQD